MTVSDPGPPRRLNLGCGFDHRPGYLNVDFQEFHHPDLNADVRDLSALPDEAYEEALALDVLEHLERSDVIPALREWRRVLIPGGSLHLRTVDLLGIGEMLAQRDDVAFHQLMVQGAYGTQAYTGDYHLAGFTDLTLIDQLFEAGFERIRVGRFHGWLLEVDARRPVTATADPIALGFDSGVSPPEFDGEGEWRWCDQKAGILLYSRTDDPIDIRVELRVFRPGNQTEVEILGCGLRHRATVSQAATISCRLMISRGPNRLSLLSHGPPVPAPDDPRTLHYKLLATNVVPVQSETDGAPSETDGEHESAAAQPRRKAVPARRYMQRAGRGWTSTRRAIQAGRQRLRHSRLSPEGQLNEWLSGLHLDDGISVVSSPTHFGGDESGEEKYAVQFTIDADFEQRLGRGLVRALVGSDRRGAALELGAGTGIFSRPLVTVTDYPSYFITDTSPEFLRRTRASIDRLGLAKRIEYAVLSGDDLDSWPTRTLSLVALRCTLHHVLDWERFIHVAARLLVPGGALAFEEPCLDGFVLQAALADVLRRSPDLALGMNDSVRRDLDLMVGTTLFYARTDVDKSASEDKHVFPTLRMLDVCREAGLVPTFHPNQGFDGELGTAYPGRDYFGAEFRHNLAVNFGFGPETMEYFDRYLAPVCEDLGVIGWDHGDPAVKAVVVATKPRTIVRQTEQFRRVSRAAWHRGRAALRNGHMR